jgi:DNA-binding IclR family transcriptional regulator
MAPDEPASGGHRAAKRALELIEHVAASPEPVSLSELARQVGLPKSSAHALARTLDDEGYLDRDERGAYTLGSRLLRLLGQLPDRYELPRVARPIMQELVDELDETAILGVRQGTAIVYIEQVEAPQFIRYAAPLGSPRPMHATSIGKVHLAFLPPDEAGALLRDLELERFTDSTRVDKRAIKAELEAVREVGYALNREESMAGVAAIALPVFEGGDPDARLVAGLSVAGPAERVRDELPDLAERLRDAARRIGAGVKPR